MTISALIYEDFSTGGRTPLPLGNSPCNTSAVSLVDFLANASASQACSAASQTFAELAGRLGGLVCRSAVKEVQYVVRHDGGGAIQSVSAMVVITDVPSSVGMLVNC